MPRMRRIFGRKPDRAACGRSGKVDAPLEPSIHLRPLRHPRLITLLPMNSSARLTALVLLATAGAVAAEEFKVQAAHSATATDYRLDPVMPPAVNDAAEKAVFTLVDGTRDRNGAGLEALHDGRVPANKDQPGSNF